MRRLDDPMNPAGDRAAREEDVPPRGRGWEKHARALNAEDFNAADMSAPRDAQGFHDWNPNTDPETEADPDYEDVFALALARRP